MLRRTFLSSVFLPLSCSREERCRFWFRSRQLCRRVSETDRLTTGWQPLKHAGTKIETFLQTVFTYGARLDSIVVSTRFLLRMSPGVIRKQIAYGKLHGLECSVVIASQPALDCDFYLIERPNQGGEFVYEYRFGSKPK